jgi:hypothetical protein
MGNDNYATFDKKWWFITIFALIGWGLFVGVNVTNTLKKCPAIAEPAK